MKKTKIFLASILIIIVAYVGCSSDPRTSSKAADANSGSTPENLSSQSKSLQETEQQIIKNERSIWEAFKAKDISMVNSLLADEAQVVTENGRFNKAEFIKIISQSPDLSSYSLGNVKVVWPSKDVAIITYDSKYSYKAAQTVSYSAYQTTVWRNVDGKWLAIFNQETLLH